MLFKKIINLNIIFFTIKFLNENNQTTIKLILFFSNQKENKK